MSKRLPFLPTVVVALAVAAMIGLGIWQLQRRVEKEALLARYAEAETLSASVPWPQGDKAVELSLYRHSDILCRRVTGMDAVAGRNRAGEPGWSHIAHCALPNGGKADVALGWSRRPEPAQWAGGAVEGIIGPGPRLVASVPPASLEPLAAPDPTDLPNNHLSYAVQWFFFALTAVVIYVLALRRRQRGG